MNAKKAQPVLKLAIPKFASLNIERSLAFFEGLGFVRGGAYPNYGIVSRDGVQLHFWLCSDPAIPQATGCRIVVDDINALFAEFAARAVIHPNGELCDRPWGTREFSILDIDGNLITFQESIAHS